MGPPVDRDVVMAPPQFNPQQYLPPPNQQAGVQKPPQDCVEKYKRLKRKYFELEEVRVVVVKTPAFPPIHPFSHIHLHPCMMRAFYRSSRRQRWNYCDPVSAHPE